MAIVKESAPNIDSTKFGEITINGKTYYSDMTIYWNGKLSYRSKEHIIELGELMKILRAGPEIIVLGTGHDSTIKITAETMAWANNKKVQIYKEITPKAAEIFNAFANDGKKVVGIFHVTC